MSRLNYSIFISVIFAIFFIIHSKLYANDYKIFDPWDFNNPNQGRELTQQSEKHLSLPSLFAMKSLKIYQEYISPVIGSRCPMYPSCSEYSVQAINKHGFFIGILMTADRLIHESDEMNKAPIVITDGAVRRYDPIIYNNFWWYKQP